MGRYDGVDDLVHSFVLRVTVIDLFDETDRGGQSHDTSCLVLVEPGWSQRPRNGTPRSLVSAPRPWSGGLTVVRLVLTTRLDVGGC